MNIGINTKLPGQIFSHSWKVSSMPSSGLMLLSAGSLLKNVFSELIVTFGSVKTKVLIKVIWPRILIKGERKVTGPGITYTLNPGEVLLQEVCGCLYHLILPKYARRSITVWRNGKN